MTTTPDHPLPIGILDELQTLLGPDQVLTDPDLRAGFEVDWTRRYSGEAAAVVRPGSTAEVAATLELCNRNGVAVIPQGGNTGLVGGGVPTAQRHLDRPALIISTRRLTRLDPVDAEAMQVTAGAGVTLAVWRDHARRAGLDTPVDFAARQSATIGGAIATNAGGSRVIRFGTMRQQVAGVEFVLPNGQVVGSLAGLPKETAGLHLAGMVTGSEGTLGIITGARLQLVPLYRSAVTALCGFAHLDAALDAVGRLRAALPQLDSIEVILPEAMALVADHLGANPPGTGDGPVGLWVVIECSDHHDPSDALHAVLTTANGLVTSAVATDSSGRDALMAFRDRITEAISARAVPFKLDIAVPLDQLASVLEVASHAASEAGAELIAFGHLAEGNLHLNYLPSTVRQDQAGILDTHAVASEVLAAVAAMGGTISAEHGIGVAKVPWLPLIRSQTELQLASAIRSDFDPIGIMNPGVLAPLSGQLAEGGT
jgi:FAD/FMN-containing dehydrogenase